MVADSARARTQPGTRPAGTRLVGTAGTTTARSTTGRPPSDPEVPQAVSDELRAAVGRDRAGGLERKLSRAIRAYEREHYRDALVELDVLARLAPGVASVRELRGLTMYRLGRWRAAARELKSLHDTSGSFDQVPVLMDCERALGHANRVGTLWDSLRRAGVDRQVLVEGRLVMAGQLADQGDLGSAIELLAPGGKALRRPDLCHLRQWYALADCYERAGDLSRARQLFARVASFDEAVTDAPTRLAALS